MRPAHRVKPLLPLLIALALLAAASAAMIVRHHERQLPPQAGVDVVEAAVAATTTAAPVTTAPRPRPTHAAAPHRVPRRSPIRRAPAAEPPPRAAPTTASRAQVEHTQEPAATRSYVRTPAVGSGRDYARSLLSAYEYDCFSSIVEHESGWSVTAANPSSGAYGLMQALPGSKMASAGSDWRTSATTQIRWGIAYIAAHYGTPCGAWSYWQNHGWY